MEFKEKLQAEMERLKLSDLATAELLDVSVPTVARWKLGLTVPHELVQKIVLEKFNSEPIAYIGRRFKNGQEVRTPETESS